MQDIQFSEKLISFLYFLPLFFISITIHEYAHALIAYRFGDNTAKDLGRLTLNPLKHIDIVGTIILPLASFSTGWALIGWAKPIPINPQKFRNIRRDDALVSSAGPISNFLMSLVFFIILAVIMNILPSQELLLNAAYYGIFLNIFLGLFNLLPIPPLDGSHILFDLFPNKITGTLLKGGLYGTFILLIFIYSPLWRIFMNLVNFMVDLLIKLIPYLI